ncbi:MAG: asparagine synthase (glutamine-hydrolyzing) [Nitratireductor sp.]|nr:asparagine synthase (glutamine-hydrolyzing) [Nitratireductor sp.]
MCGLTGVWSHQGIDHEVIERMTDRLRHRGPDGDGTWMDSEAGLALGHRRLAIVDISQAGRQPMVSQCGRHVVVFNGEIYNHAELRREIEADGAAPSWRGRSDTETLVAAIARWGFGPALRRASGMFAIACFDRKERVLRLARDRLGEKPLYYGWAGGSFVFASELKALNAHPDFRQRLCRTALTQYLRFSHVPAPRSIWRGIFKLEPGTVLTVDGRPPSFPPAAPIRPNDRYGTIRIDRYWSLAEVVAKGAAEPVTDPREAVDRLEQTLADAVRMQMMSDVPLGAFLSGGIDSSTVTALMQAASDKPVETYTIGFGEAEFDESGHARLVAEHLGTKHTEIPVTAAEARAVIPRLPELFDEPFADASQIPTFLVCEAARRHVKVALTGDGGDELFGGYPRHARAPKVWGWFSTMPFAVRQTLGTAMTAVPVEWWDRLGELRPGEDRGITGDRFHRVASRLSQVRSLDGLYLDLVSAWPDPASLMAGETGTGDLGLLDDPVPAGAQDPASRMMYLDAMTYLPDDILCKVDRVSMGVSLETRAPLLDRDVVSLACRLPASMKIHDGVGKWALRQVLHRYVPRELVERPKVGFYLPVGEWLRGPLREWAESLLSRERLESEGLLDPGTVRRVWAEHLSGRRNWTARLWTVLMLEAWLESAGSPRTERPSATDRAPAGASAIPVI